MTEQEVFFVLKCGDSLYDEELLFKHAESEVPGPGPALLWFQSDVDLILPVYFETELDE